MIAVLSFGRNLGENLRSIPTFIGIVVALGVSTLYSHFTVPQDVMTTALLIFVYTFLVSFSRYSIISQKYSVLVLSLALCFGTFASSANIDFNMPEYALKLGTSCAIGYAVLLFCSFFPFPFIARRTVRGEMDTATKCLELLIRMLSASFESSKFRSQSIKMVEIKTLITVCSRKLAFVDNSLSGIKIEALFSDVTGLVKMRQFLGLILSLCKSMFASMNEFDDLGRINQVRSKIGPDVVEVAKKATEALQDVFINLSPQDSNKELSEAISKLKISLNFDHNSKSKKNTADLTSSLPAREFFFDDKDKEEKVEGNNPRTNEAEGERNFPKTCNKHEIELKLIKTKTNQIQTDQIWTSLTFSRAGK